MSSCLAQQFVWFQSIISWTNSSFHSAWTHRGKRLMLAIKSIKNKFLNFRQYKKKPIFRAVFLTKPIFICLIMYIMFNIYKQLLFVCLRSTRFNLLNFEILKTNVSSRVLPICSWIWERRLCKCYHKYLLFVSSFIIRAIMLKIKWKWKPVCQNQQNQSMGRMQFINYNTCAIQRDGKNGFVKHHLSLVDINIWSDFFFHINIQMEMTVMQNWIAYRFAFFVCSPPGLAKCKD